jgi:hypothetical protein
LIVVLICTYNFGYPTCAPLDPSAGFRDTAEISCPDVYLLLWFNCLLIFTGVCRSALLLEDRSPLPAPLPEGCVDVIFSSTRNMDRESELFDWLSRKMIEIEAAGQSAYVQANTLETDNCKGQFEVEALHVELQNLSRGCTLRSSMLYQCQCSQNLYHAPRRLDTKRFKPDGTEVSQPSNIRGNSVFVCLHTMENKAIVCILAESALNVCGHWKHLGGSVMDILNQHSFMGGCFRLHTLRIRNWEGLDGPARRCFHEGICSRHKPGLSISRMQALGLPAIEPAALQNTSEPLNSL